MQQGILLLTSCKPRLIDPTSLHLSVKLNMTIQEYSQFNISKIRYLQKLLLLLLIYLIQKKENGQNQVVIGRWYPTEQQLRKFFLKKLVLKPVILLEKTPYCFTAMTYYILILQTHIKKAIPVVQKSIFCILQ